MIRGFGKWWSIVGGVAIFMTLASSASALDAYQDRRGFFGGIGLGGGGAFEGSSPGGALLFDFQLGGGAAQNVTLCLDTDLWIYVMDSNRNLLLTPGPELNYFFGDSGFFIRAGIGMALTFSWYDRVDDDAPAGGKEPGNTDFRLGFDGSLGVGFEFFANSNLAFGLAVEGDYIVLKGDDLASVGFSMSLKHY